MRAWGGTITQDDGLTLVEVLVACAVLLVGLLGVLTIVDVAGSTTQRSLARERATTLAREVLERARHVPWAAQGAPAFAAGVRAAVPDAGALTADGRAFTVRRATTTYRVTVTSCKEDDPLDGVGVHDATYCDFADPPAGGAPAPGAPSGSAVTLKLLGLPVAVPLGGALVDTTVCGLLGANPVGAVPALDALLGRGGAADRVLGLIDSGAELALCPGGQGSERFALDRDPADFARVAVRVAWTHDGRPAEQRQSTMVVNPSGA